MMSIAFWAAKFLSFVAAFFLIGMVGINVVDVLLRSTINAPIFGTYEIVELMLAAVAFLVIPEAFLRRQHVTVEMIDQILPRRAVKALRIVGDLLAFVFLTLLAYAMIWPAIDYVVYREVTLDLHLPLIWRAAPVFLGILAAALAAGVVLVWEFRSSTTDKTNREGGAEAISHGKPEGIG